MKIEVSHKTAEKIELTDLSSDLQHLVEVVGIELVRKLIVEMGGTGNPIYFPDALSFDKAVFRMIETEYEGTDLREISFRTGISLRRLKGINKKYRKEHSS